MQRIKKFLSIPVIDLLSLKQWYIKQKYKVSCKVIIILKIDFSLFENM